VVDAGTVMPLPGIAREASKSVDKILTRWPRWAAPPKAVFLLGEITPAGGTGSSPKVNNSHRNVPIAKPALLDAAAPGHYSLDAG